MPKLCKEKIISEEYADWIIDFELTEELRLLDQSGVDYCYEKIDEELGIIYVKKNQIEEMNLLNYPYQQIPAVLGFPGLITESVTEGFNDDPLIQSGIMQIQAEPLELVGEGVVIALIGTGIDYRNPLFQNPDGTTRILAIWDQTIEDGTESKEVPFGRVYSRGEINQALKEENPETYIPTRDEKGITTVMAAVAAGSNIINPSVFTGAAPRADLVVVKCKECKKYLREYYLLSDKAAAYQSTDLMLAIKYVDSFVREFFRPVIFCIGFGTNLGSHSGTSPLSRYLKRIGEKRGRTVIITGGEEGNRSHHFYGKFNNSNISDQNSKVIEMEIRVGEDERGFLMEVWGRIPDRFLISVKSPSGEEIPSFGIRSNKGREYTFIYEKTKITATYALITSGGGDELISFRFQAPTPGIWTVSIEKEEGISESDFHAWLPLEDFLSSETYFLKPDPEITLTVPSFTENAVCVSSYSTKTNSIYVESGRGFSRGIQIKPDLAGPAVNISVPGKSFPGQLRVGRQTGSILAAALTAGGTAQLLQWAYTDRKANYLNSNEVKDLLILGAKREGRTSYPNSFWGFGRLSIQGIFDILAKGQ